MDRNVPPPVVDERLAQAILERKVEMATNLFRQIELSSEGAAPEVHLVKSAEVFAQVNQLEVGAKVALVRKLIAHLDTDAIQSILEFGQRELAERQQQSSASNEARQTRLLLKKDYTYQNRGLSEPTQYYVYLRRRKPKLDRYIGTLFYVPQGCTLSYLPDAEGRIIFNPPYNVFRLKDCKNPNIIQVVRLIGLEPPPPDYTFTKQQDDNPDIRLRLEYLDPQTYQPIAEESYSFPFCMYEGGELDRYRWDVSIATAPSQSASNPSDPQSATTPEVTSQPQTSSVKPAAEKKPPVTVPSSPTAKSSRRAIELPHSAATATFYLANRCDASLILERMRLWVTWSERSMPQSKWEILQTENEAVYTLVNATFKRKILTFSLDQASITLENSLPVVMKWFHDLSLAVSQSQNRRQYSAAQLKLAHSLFVDMSLPQNDSLIVLKKLFGIKFSKTSLYQS
jgi:hypothetical protein